MQLCLEEIIENIVESRYIGIFLIICKIFDIDIILYIIIGKIINIAIDGRFIKKLSIAKKITYRPPLCTLRRLVGSGKQNIIPINQSGDFTEGKISPKTTTGEITQ